MRFSSPRTVLGTNGTRNIFIALKLLQSIQTNIKKTDFNTFKISIFVIQDFFLSWQKTPQDPNLSSMLRSSNLVFLNDFLYFFLNKREQHWILKMMVNCVVPIH